MPQPEPQDSRFEPALLLALIAMVGVALGKDVFYDIASQAVAMSALALLILALVMPLLNLVERALSPRTTLAAKVEFDCETDEPVCPPAPTPEPLRPVSLEKNASSADVYVRCSAIIRNENRSWTESFVTHRQRL